MNRWRVQARWCLALAVGLAGATSCGPGPGGTASQPESRPDLPEWMAAHRAFVERAKRGKIDLLFLGDSITQGWRSQGALWDRHYLPRRAANFGLGGDRTGHVLWRIDHGEVDGLNPKVVVLMIGTNNVGPNTVEEAAAGIESVVDRLAGKLPGSKILLLGLLPRGKVRIAEYAKAHEVAEPDPRIAEVNRRIAKLDDGVRVRYLDIGGHFVDRQGRVERSKLYDFLHLTEEGYRAWAEAMEPTLSQMLE